MPNDWSELHSVELSNLPDGDFLYKFVEKLRKLKGFPCTDNREVFDVVREATESTAENRIKRSRTRIQRGIVFTQNLSLQRCLDTLEDKLGEPTVALNLAMEAILMAFYAGLALSADPKEIKSVVIKAELVKHRRQTDHGRQTVQKNREPYAKFNEILTTEIVGALERQNSNPDKQIKLSEVILPISRSLRQKLEIASRPKEWLDLSDTKSNNMKICGRIRDHINRRFPRDRVSGKFRNV